VTYDGSSWNTPVDIDPNTLISVSCPLPSFCAAMDFEGNAVTYTVSPKADQTIIVTAHAPATAVSGTSFTVAATAPAGAVVYSSFGVCSNVGATFTMTSGTGTCTVKYDQPGNDSYNVAPQVVETVSAAVPRFTLTIAKAGGGSGTVTSSAGGINCGTTCAADFDSGTSVALTATPAENSTFAGWSGACSGTGLMHGHDRRRQDRDRHVPPGSAKESLLRRPEREAQATGDCQTSNRRRPLPHRQGQEGPLEDRAKGPRDLAEAEGGEEACARLEGELGRQSRQTLVRISGRRARPTRGPRGERLIACGGGAPGETQRPGLLPSRGCLRRASARVIS
jgi:hypothetical protein